MFRIRRILAIPDAPDDEPDPDWNVVSPQTTYLVTEVRDGNTLPWVSSMVHGFMRPGLKKLNCARLSHDKRFRVRVISKYFLPAWALGHSSGIGASSGCSLMMYSGISLTW